ncbi:MAG: hypothetical protein ACYC2G_05190 [Gemmatimonadaceae bacterium]
MRIVSSGAGRRAASDLSTVPVSWRSMRSTSAASPAGTARFTVTDLRCGAEALGEEPCRRDHRCRAAAGRRDEQWTGGAPALRIVALDRGAGHRGRHCALLA